MFRVLVVEDEPPIMRAVCTGIENANPRFEIAATAMNGKRAIEILKMQSIDIIFTDIRMPVMDGLALAEWVKNNRPDIVVVIVSGYQDFEYARKAIEYKVYDYLLKPISSDKMAELLQKAEKELESRNKVSKKEYLQSAASGNRREISEDTDCTIMLVCAGAYPVYGYTTLMPASRFWNEFDAQTVIENELLEGESHIFFNSNSQSERFVVIETADEQRRRGLAEDIFKKLCNDDIAITVVYKSDIKMSEAGEWFAKLSECVIKNLRLGISQLICCDEVKVETEKRPYSKEQIDYIISAAVGGAKEKLLSQLEDVFSGMCECRSTQEDVLLFLNMIVDTYSFANPGGKNLRKELNSAVMGFSGYMSLAADVAAILLTVKMNADKTELSDRRTKLIEDVERYLIENYSKSITNDTLSKEFGFVPSYISRIFRQGKGVSPSEYLVRYRIEVAKKLLSGNNDLMIKEIADMVGFKEPYYFSKTFKKETGVWPSEYHG